MTPRTLLEYGPAVAEPGAGPAGRIPRATRCGSTTTSSSCRCAGAPHSGRVIARLLRGLPLQRLPGELRHQRRLHFHRGIDKVRQRRGITSRGVLLDIVRLRGGDLLRDRESGSPATNSTRQPVRKASRSRRATSSLGPNRLVGTLLETATTAAEPGAGRDWTCASVAA